MRITKRQIRRVIKESVRKLSEQSSPVPGRPEDAPDWGSPGADISMVSDITYAAQRALELCDMGKHVELELPNGEHVEISPSRGKIIITAPAGDWMYVEFHANTDSDNSSHSIALVLNAINSY